MYCSINDDAIKKAHEGYGIPHTPFGENQVSVLGIIKLLCKKRFNFAFQFKWQCGSQRSQFFL